MDRMPPLVLRFSCPFSRPDGYRTDGFLGAWSPHRPLQVQGEPCDPSRAALLGGANWLLCSAVASVAGGSRPKIHRDHANNRSDRAGERGLAFRGYVVEPPLHHFSAPADLWDFWGKGGGRRLNGLFATALIESDPNRLTLRTDALGFSPLYYRNRDGLVLFGTKPDFLVTGDAELDPLGAATLMAHNYPACDRTLFQGVHRCPVGTALRFEGDVMPIHDVWMSADDLPTPERPVDESALRHLEATFTRAVRRCNALDYGPAHLPLSGGHDSRRILGVLLKDRTPFRSSTVRVYQKGGRDLDARYAAEVAGRFGFEHAAIDLPPPDEYARDDARRRLELCAETWMHGGWVGPFMRALPAEPVTLLDGFLGDVLGVPGYRLAGADFFHDPEADIETIASDVAASPLRRHVAPPFCSAVPVQDEVRRYLAPFSSLRNVAELAFLLLRQRRATALWSHQLVPPEHLVTCPYTDLDYLQAVLALRPEDRCATPLQHASLQRFHPELAAIAGSRAFPANLPATGRKGNRQRSRACMRRLCGEIAPAHRQALRERLAPMGRALATTGALSPEAVAWHWALRPIYEALLHDRTAAVVWHTGAWAYEEAGPGQHRAAPAGTESTIPKGTHR